MNRSLAIGLYLFLALVITSMALAQAPDFTGTWAGAMNRQAGPAGLEITLAREGESWKATMKMRLPGGETEPAVEELKITGSETSFHTVFPSGVVARFKGKFDGDKLDGTFEAFRGDAKVGQGTIALTRGGQMPAVQQAQAGGQMADPNFDAKVEHPAYTKDGPRVLFDEAHNNFHTASGRYKPFC